MNKRMKYRKYWIEIIDEKYYVMGKAFAKLQDAINYINELARA